MANQVYLANKVQYLKSVTFSQLTRDEKLSIKQMGRPMPDLVITKECKNKDKKFKRQFNRSVYKHDWICGCEETNTLFCFPCLLFSNLKSAWTTTGVDDLTHLSMKIQRHAEHPDHLHRVIDFNTFGKIDIGDYMGSAYKQSIAKYNVQVAKNRDALSKIINIIKLCGKFELPLRGHDEKAGSNNPGVFLGLIEYTCSLDSSLETHIDSSKVFKGTSKTIQNELLESILKVSRDKNKEEVRSVDYVSVMIDETTDNYDKTQMVIVLRYVLKGRPVE